MPASGGPSLLGGPHMVVRHHHISTDAAAAAVAVAVAVAAPSKCKSRGSYPVQFRAFLRVPGSPQDCQVYVRVARKESKNSC
eukprot:487809-Pelagomonas_calceolata.AAC.4